MWRYRLNNLPWTPLNWPADAYIEYSLLLSAPNNHIKLIIVDDWLNVYDNVLLTLNLGEVYVQTDIYIK